MSKRSVLIMGLPHAGKSTFIAALYHMIKGGLTDSSLMLESVFGVNVDHLQSLERKWLSGEDLGRTYTEDEKTATLYLIDSASKEQIELHIPDMSGETYSAQWESRVSPKEYLEYSAGVSGILLFVHPLMVKQAETVVDANALANAIGCLDETAPKTQKDNADQNKSIPQWSAKNTPTQVQLIELLQFISYYCDRHFKVAILVSAWDEVCQHQSSPQKFIADRLPMLFQFLQANEQLFDFKTYGISALGGNLKKDKNALLMKKPSDRIIVVDGDSTSNDITLPIKWLCLE